MWMPAIIRRASGSFSRSFTSVAHAALHLVEIVGDEGGKNALDAVFAQAVARVLQRFRGESFAVEVGAGVAVDLKIEHGRQYTAGRGNRAGIMKK